MADRPLVRDVVWLAGLWVLVFAVTVGGLLLATDGEPVCEGPLIYDWDDSDPPQCNDPIEGLRRNLVPILVGSLLVASLVRVVIVSVAIAARRRSRDAERSV